MTQNFMMHDTKRPNTLSLTIQGHKLNRTSQVDHDTSEAKVFTSKQFSVSRSNYPNKAEEAQSS